MANNFVLGRGELQLGQFRAGTQIPRGERYMGNSPEIALSAEQETLDHYSSDRGVRVKDASVVLQLNYTGSFILDDISRENLAMFFMGSSAVQTVTASTVTDEEIIGVEQDLRYQLGTSPSAPSGARQVSNVVVKDKTTPATQYTAGVDYLLDPVLARITIVKGGGIANDTSLLVSYSVEASTRDVIISRSMSVEGALRYISRNPAGEQLDYYMPWVKITPNGDFALKSDEWQQLPFTIEILKKGDMEAIYMDGRPYTP